MADQLSLSIWLQQGSRSNSLRHFEKLLRLFPFSQREQGQSTVVIQAIDSTEPPLLERPVNGPVDASEVLEIFNDYTGEDLSYQLESWWDLWQFKDGAPGGDWALAPARVGLAWFGPEFDNRTERNMTEQEDLRIDFGLDSHYLPRTEKGGAARLTESNIKSLLRLVHELDATLPVVKRTLETESGENFAERLQQALKSS